MPNAIVAHMIDRVLSLGRDQASCLSRLFFVLRPAWYARQRTRIFRATGLTHPRDLPLPFPLLPCLASLSKNSSNPRATFSQSLRVRQYTMPVMVLPLSLSFFSVHSSLISTRIQPSCCTDDLKVPAFRQTLNARFGRLKLDTWKYRGIVEGATASFVCSCCIESAKQISSMTFFVAVAVNAMMGVSGKIF